MATQMAEMPQLRHCTLVERNDKASLTLVVGRRYFELTELEGSRADFLRLKRFLDGRHTVAQISDATGIPKPDVEEVLQVLSKVGLLRSASAEDAIPRARFLQQIDETSEMWSRQIGYHRLFGQLESGDAAREVFLGLLLETYHYVKSARVHISTAKAHAQNEGWKQLLLEYENEERDHDRMILAALDRVGLSKQLVVTAHPLIGTLSLINMLCDIGRQSTLSYFVCTSLFEAREQDFAGAKASLESIANRYGFPSSAVAPLIEHMAGDLKCEHSGLLQQALSSESEINIKDAHEAANWLHDLKHAFDQYHDQILQYYSDSSNYIPRPKVDYFAL